MNWKSTLGQIHWFYCMPLNGPLSVKCAYNMHIPMESYLGISLQNIEYDYVIQGLIIIDLIIKHQTLWE